MCIRDRIPVILYNFSLVGGFSAPKITSVLDATGYLTGAPEAALRRLTDTGRFVFDIAEAGALRPWQPGWKAALRVRAKHARVRRLLRKRGWPEVPLNAADVMVTQLAFSYNVIVGLEIILGSALGAHEAAAYLALWRWAGALLGLPDEANACADGLPAAKAWLESYIVHQLHPTALSQRVAHHLLDAPAAVAHRGDSEQRRRVFTYNAQLTRLLIGDALGDALAPVLRRVATARAALAALPSRVRPALPAAAPRVGARLCAPDGCRSGAAAAALAGSAGGRHAPAGRQPCCGSREGERVSHVICRE